VLDVAVDRVCKELCHRVATKEDNSKIIWANRFGWAVRALANEIEGPVLKTQLVRNIFHNSLCPHSSKWVLNSLQSGEGEGGREEEWCPTSITPLVVPVASLSATFPTAIIGYGTVVTFFKLFLSSPGNLSIMILARWRGSSACGEATCPPHAEDAGHLAMWICLGVGSCSTPSFYKSIKNTITSRLNS